ncbi:hypothetical protein [Larkinella rosea]|uniref:Polysaccharide biosynthesis protein n=1 Tax=Larkinella rosea TaxID=2025312 RepID=A0A3P1BTP0_9BACT|nr:hypothetical protein [Larkinella rosea]RRB04226.1 hypothetical protein EHT25_11950 [Larkinella rosea]
MIKKATNYLWNSPTAMTWGSMLSNSIKLLVLTPLILIKYNVDEIAFWYLLLTINSFTVVVDFGFYPTFSRIISYAFSGLRSIEDFGKPEIQSDGKPNWDLMNRIYGTINVTYIALGFLVLFIVFIFSYFSIENIILKSNTNTGTLWSAYYLFIVSIFFQFISKKFDAVIIGTNHVALINRWNIIINLLSALASILVVYIGANLAWLSFIQLLFSIILVLRSALLEYQICDGMFRKLNAFIFDREIFKWCWGPTWKSGVLILCSTGVSQATGLIYSYVANPVSLASYLLSLKLVTTVAQFSQAPFYSKLPLFSTLRVKNNIEQLSTISAQSIKKSLLVFVLGMLVLIFFGDWILTLVKANTTLIDSKILIFMAFVWFLERNHAMHAQIYVTTNRVPFYKSAVITGIANLGIVWLMLPSYGILAFPVAHGLSNLLINNWWNVDLSISSLQEDLWRFIRRSMAIPLLTLIILSSFKILTLFNV